MLCFLFAGLIVALDQFIKRWIVRTLEIREVGPDIIPGVIGLTRWENDGAMLNILAGQQWLLAGIAFVVAIVLIMILLRYNEGFWGTLGLAAVLGGTIGNLIDRVFNDGKVIDMFRTLFFNFPIYNIADIFITLGFAVFLIHFITLSFGSKKKEPAEVESVPEEYSNEHNEDVYDEFPEIDSIVAAQSEQEYSTSSAQQITQAQYAAESEYIAESDYTSERENIPQQEDHLSEQEYSSSQMQSDAESEEQVSYDYDPSTDTTPDLSFTLDSLESELELLEEYGDYDVNDLLREYGFEDDD
ncbi:MAG: signal peptidase II [Oscillospiraceae bacterium]|jgi:signal peptidase II|nr:signal peptidase II [Oscillospiraceae bacterium]